MTDGRGANVARDGGGRSEAEAEALVAARRLALTGIPGRAGRSRPRPQDGGRAAGLQAGRAVPARARRAALMLRMPHLVVAEAVREAQAAGRG
ncbi:hypothetical protein ACRAWF_01825 [Streptomyces sp. L7]